MGVDRSEISLIYPSSANRLAFKLGQMRQTQWKAEYFPTENRKVFGSSPLVKQQPPLSTFLDFIVVVSDTCRWCYALALISVATTYHTHGGAAIARWTGKLQRQLDWFNTEWRAKSPWGQWSSTNSTTTVLCFNMYLSPTIWGVQRHMMRQCIKCIDLVNFEQQNMVLILMLESYNMLLGS